MAKLAPAGRGESYVYLLHFSEPVGRHQHYYRNESNLAKRFRLHTMGKSGVRLVSAAVRQGATIMLANYWPGGREKELEIKSWKNAKQLCDICRENSPRQAGVNYA